MKKQVVQKEIYITEDGREFDDVSKAERHEEKSYILNILKQHQPLDDVYHTVYINNIPEEKITDDLIRIFKVKDKIINVGWNLLHDNGVNATCQSIDKIFKEKLPDNVLVLNPEEQKGVAHFKKAIAEIVLRNTRLQATPEAILGNLIMELQDLIR